MEDCAGSAVSSSGAVAPLAVARPAPAPTSRSAHKAPVSVAALKAEYITPVAPDREGESSRYEPIASGHRSKRGRGLLNASRKTLCAHVAAGQPCAFEGECRNSHDVVAFMASKPADAGPECAFFRRYGYCPHGFACRFGDCHIDLFSDPQRPRLVELSTAQRLPGLDLDTNAVSPKLLLVIRQATRALKQANKQRDGLAPGDNNARKQEQTEQVIGGAQKKKKQKKKLPSEVGVPEHLQQCRAFARNACTYGDKCRWSHHTIPAAPAVAEEAAAAAATGEAATTAVAAVAVAPASPSTSTAASSSFSVAPDEDPTRQFGRHVCAYLAGAGHVPRARKTVDFRGKVYVGPLTTVGNLPFRRVVKRLGADVTCGEMALATSLLAGNMAEWALLRRHPEEDVFGVQIVGHHADHLAQCCAMLDHMNVDFVDLNMGCPIDLLVNSGAGSAAMRPSSRGKMGGACAA